MVKQILSRTPLRAGLAVAASFAFAAAPQAQVVFDNFDDGDVSDVTVFQGGDAGIGVGPTTGIGGEEGTGLSVGINPGSGGSFAGFTIPGGAGTTDISEANYLTFYFRPTSVQAANLPLTFEINLQEDANGNGTYEGATEDEFQAVYRVQTGDGYMFVEIPLSSFSDDNSVNAGANDGFDFENLLQIVVAAGGLQGPEFQIGMDEIVFTDESQITYEAATEFDFFDDGDVSDISTFSATGAGIGVGQLSTSDGSTGEQTNALSVGINPAETGAFAGFVIPGGDGTTDVSGADYLVFRFRPTSVQAANLPLTLEINLQEDTNGNGTYEAATEDEFQANYRVTSLDDEFVDVRIPLSSFGDDNSVNAGANDGFDFENLFQIVFAVGGLQGPEFTFAIDDLGFATGTMMGTAAEALPTSFRVAPSVYPNPTATGATVAFELSSPSDVSVDVVDLLGRQVVSLTSGARAAGPVRLAVPTADLPAGVYAVRVRTDEGTAVTRMTVVR